MAFSQLTDSQKEDMIVSLSCLVLHGSGKPVDAEGIKAIVEATGHEVAGYWPSLMAKFLAEKDIDELLMKPGMGGGPAAGGAPAGGDGAAAAAEEEEEEEEEEDESVSGGGGGLFGDDSSS